jgi:nitroreductase
MRSISQAPFLSYFLQEPAKAHSKKRRPGESRKSLLESYFRSFIRISLSLTSEIDVWLTTANGSYGSDPRLARDEAIRSSSLAAITLILAAGNRGYASCPIGFNPVQVMEILSTSDHYVPVMMLAVGRPASGNSARRPRLPGDQVLAFNISLE